MKPLRPGPTLQATSIPRHHKLRSLPRAGGRHSGPSPRARVAERRTSRGNGASPRQATPPPDWESGSGPDRSGPRGDDAWRCSRSGGGNGRCWRAALAPWRRASGRHLGARVEARVDGPSARRSAQPGRVWWVAFEGAELRMYRNGLRWGRCPGRSGCTRGPRESSACRWMGRASTRRSPSPGPGKRRGTLRRRHPGPYEGVTVALTDPLIVY
jgi:hypothetical protein